jgi:hypothetical protein
MDGVNNYTIISLLVWRTRMNKIKVVEMWFEDVVWIELAQERTLWQGSCEYYNKSSGFVNGAEFLDQLSCYHLLKKHSADWVSEWICMVGSNETRSTIVLDEGINSYEIIVDRYVP